MSKFIKALRLTLLQVFLFIVIIGPISICIYYFTKIALIAVFIIILLAGVFTCNYINVEDKENY